MEENVIIEHPEAPEVDDSWKIKTLIIGGVLGALTGVGAAYLLTKRAERKGQPLNISTGQGMKLGMLLVSFVRNLLSL